MRAAAGAVAKASGHLKCSGSRVCCCCCCDAAPHQHWCQPPPPSYRNY
jgi:hypothetical protein